VTYLVVLGLALSAIGSLFFSILSYALRDFARTKLGEELEKRGRGAWLDRVLEHTTDLVFVTAMLRVLFNILILIYVLRLLAGSMLTLGQQYVLGIVCGFVITVFVSVAIPSAVARHAAEETIAIFAPFLLAVRAMLRPVTFVMRGIDSMVKQASGTEKEEPEEQIEQEILSAVEEGAEQGVVDQQEQEMIKSVIEFRDTTAGQIMTARPEIVGLESKATLAEVKTAIEETGRSRLPVYEGDLDHILGILYARDLLQYLGERPAAFDIKSAMRPAFYVPEMKPLRDLLKDFRQQKVHIAIVLDEYGGTAGLVTIEDVLEELVGEISEEHEAGDSSMLKKLDEKTAEADARIYVDELNRQMEVGIPEDEGYSTLGGFISTTLGKIPQTGATFEHGGVKYTVLDAEPQKVNRVRLQVQEKPASETPS